MGMPIYLSKTKEKVSVKVWQSATGDCEKLESATMIQDLLKYLKEEGILLSVAYGKHSLGQTILERFSDRHLQFDSPRPLPNTPLDLRVSFKYRDQLQHYFDTRIASASGLQLKTLTPSEIFRFQRRGHYRVDVPAGSSVSFRNTDRTFSEVTVRNVSASGMLLCTGNGQCFREGDRLSGISMDLLLLDCIKPFRMKINEGKIVRTVSETGRHCYGAALSLSPREEDSLWTYVRLRERELLSKGVAER